jgi:hypothetical protein
MRKRIDILNGLLESHSEGKSNDYLDCEAAILFWPKAKEIWNGMTLEKSGTKFPADIRGAINLFDVLQYSRNTDIAISTIPKGWRISKIEQVGELFSIEIQRLYENLNTSKRKKVESSDASLSMAVFLASIRVHIIEENSEEDVGYKRKDLVDFHFVDGFMREGRFFQYIDHEPNMCLILEAKDGESSLYRIPLSDVTSNVKD